MNSLNPVMRIDDQIVDAHPRAREPRPSAEGSSAHRRAHWRRSGCPRRRRRAIPHELSGGMKQRAVMAIATSLQPKVIVADEPTSALDVVVQRQVMQTLGRLQDGLGAAVVLIGHDMGLIAQFADTIGVMYAGRLVENGPVDEMLESPEHPYTRLLIDSLPTLEDKQALAASRACRRRCSTCRRAAASLRAVRSRSTAAVRDAATAAGRARATSRLPPLSRPCRAAAHPGEGSRTRGGRA